MMVIHFMLFLVSVCFATVVFRVFACCLFLGQKMVVVHSMFFLVSGCVATLYFASQSRSPPFKCQRREHCLENVERHN